MLYKIYKFVGVHVIVWSVLFVFTYGTYVGLFYDMDLGFVEPAVRAGLIFAILAIWFSMLQKVKGVDNLFFMNFDVCIWIERLLFFLLPVVLGFCLQPINYALNVFADADEIEERFVESINSTEEMFAKYEEYCEIRIENYENFLKKLKDEKSLDPAIYQEIGFDGSHDDMKIETEIATLNRQLKGIMNYQRLDTLAENWVNKVNNKTSVLNVFLLGDINAVETAINEWSGDLESFSDKILSTEKYYGVPAHKFDNDDEYINGIVRELNVLRDIYNPASGRDELNSWTILVGIIMWFVLILPWYMQDRHGANAYNIIGSRSTWRNLRRTYRSKNKQSQETKTTLTDEQMLAKIKEYLNSKNNVDNSATTSEKKTTSNNEIINIGNNVKGYTFEGHKSETGNNQYTKQNHVEEQTAEPKKYDVNNFFEKYNERNTPKEITTFLKKIQLDDIDHIDLVANILNEIRKDNNILYAEKVKYLVEEGFITYDDLKHELIGVDKDFVDTLSQDKFDNNLKTNNNTTRGAVKSSPNDIRNSTEIFLWGIPSTGKTCALGAILSVIQNGKYVRSFNDLGCYGYGVDSSIGIRYMTDLCDSFARDDKKVVILPKSTEGTYEMSFEIGDNSDRIHPITLIDFAGERINDISYKNYENEQMKDVNKILVGGGSETRKNNRKIHFIIVEYGCGEGQIKKLNDTINYINETGIFKNNTNAICLIVTKSDRLNPDNYDDCNAKANEYMQNGRMKTFTGALKKVCKDNRVGGFEILPFSLGKVCFQRYCKLNTEYAEEIVKEIIKRSYAESSVLQKILGV